MCIPFLSFVFSVFFFLLLARKRGCVQYLRRENGEMGTEKRRNKRKGKTPSVRTRPKSNQTGKMKNRVTMPLKRQTGDERIPGQWFHPTGENCWRRTLSRKFPRNKGPRALGQSSPLVRSSESLTMHDAVNVPKMGFSTWNLQGRCALRKRKRGKGACPKLQIMLPFADFVDQLPTHCSVNH